MKTGGKRLAGLRTICLAGALAVSVSMTAFGADAWDKVGDRFVYSDGTTIRGALEKGVSVSKYQNTAGKIDWEQVKKEGVTFVMVRLGYQDELDPYFEENVTEASAAGLKVGVIFYSQAQSVAAARKEAEFVLDIVKDYPISFPIACDAESQKMSGKHLSSLQMTNQINGFCQVVYEAGYQPVVYGTHTWLTRQIDVNQIDYDIWDSRYGVPGYLDNRTLWQCTDEGQVDGITGAVCIEFAFIDYDKMILKDLWREIGGKKYYYKDYRKQTGWVEVKEKQYYLDKDGAMVYDTSVEIDGKLYVFDKDGSPTEIKQTRTGQVR